MVAAARTLDSRNHVAEATGQNLTGVNPAVIERAIAARIAQGLPPTIEDPKALALVASIVATTGAAR
jgi:hypothetical protein